MMLTQPHQFQKNVERARAGQETTTVSDPDAAVEVIAKQIKTGAHVEVDFPDGASRSYVEARLKEQGLELS